MDITIVVTVEAKDEFQVTLEGVTISMNGPAQLSMEDLIDLTLVVIEATQVLKEGLK